MEGMGDEDAEKLEEEKEACFSKHIYRKVHDYRKPEESLHPELLSLICSEMPLGFHSRLFP